MICVLPQSAQVMVMGVVIVTGGTGHDHKLQKQFLCPPGPGGTARREEGPKRSMQPSPNTSCISLERRE